VGRGQTYKSAKFYKFMFSLIPPDHALRAIWKSRCLPKLRVFAWLLMKDQLNTKDLMLRKNWHIESGPYCVLCANQVLETRGHFFFDCSFTKSCRDICNM
jgi:hypothetical protein